MIDVKTHVANMVLAAQHMSPENVRDAARRQSLPALAAVRDANDIADLLTPHLLAFRELLEAAEAAGWDGHQSTKAVLDRAREAHAALTGWSNEGAKS